MLRKSKEDRQNDAALRRNHNSQDFFDQEIDDVALANLEADDEALSYEGLSSESLVTAYHSIARSSLESLEIIYFPKDYICMISVDFAS